MIYLFSGVPRSGKTLKAVTVMKKYIDENDKLPLDKQRQIYSNIDGLIFDEVLPLPADYRTAPHSSIFFIDEAQLIDIFSSSGNDKNNEIARSLSIHGHFGYDFYFITQHPTRLVKNLTDMVSHHYHFSRVLNGSQAKFYYWSSCCENPNAPTNKRNALDSGIFFYPKDSYKFYVSSTDHTNIKMKIPRKFWYMLAFLIFVISLAIYLVKHYVLNSFTSLATNSTSAISNSIKGLSNEKSSNKNTLPVVSIPKSDIPFNASATNPNANYNASSSYKSFNYDVSKPFDTVFNGNYPSPSFFPVFSGAVIIGNLCFGYTQQGTKINLKKSDCLRIAKGDMPFNPFKQQINQQTTNSNINNNSTTNSNQNRSMNLPNKNIIEPSSS
jgi:hypothetical protein